MVHEFYATYTTTILSTLPKVTHTRVRGWKVDISEATIHRILFGPEFLAPRSTAEYDYKLGQTKDKALTRD